MSLQFSSRRVCSTNHLLSITRVTYIIISLKFYPQNQISLSLLKKTTGSWLHFKESILVAKSNWFLELTLLSSHLHPSYPPLKMLKLNKRTQKKKLNKQNLHQLLFQRVSQKLLLQLLAHPRKVQRVLLLQSFQNSLHLQLLPLKAN